MAGYMKDLGNGKFQFEVSAGRDGKGKRDKKYRTITAKGSTPEARRKYAEKQLALFVAEVETGQYQDPSKYTFSTYVNEWKKKAERKLAPKTFFRYMELLNMRIIPAIGNEKIDKINPVMLDNFYEELREPQKKIREYADGRKKEIEYTLSDETIHYHHRVIRLILQTAYKKGLIKENPCARADAPKIKKKKPKSYEMEDITALMAALENVSPEELKYKVAVIIAITGGCRLGEVVGIEPSKDIDYVNNTVHIQRASQYLPGKGIYPKDPKNEGSDRVISLPKEVIDTIKELDHQNKLRRVKLGSKWRGFGSKDENGNDTNMPDRLFITVDGRPMYPDTPSKWFNEFLKENNLTPLVFHGLRHTSASYLIAEGEDVVTVSKRLGHSNTSTTLNIYSHSFKKRDEAAATKMSGLFKKKDQESQTK
jgi:integrase